MSHEKLLLAEGGPPCSETGPPGIRSIRLAILALVMLGKSTGVCGFRVNSRICGGRCDVASSDVLVVTNGRHTALVRVHFE